MAGRNVWDDSFFMVHGWMLKKLRLKGAALEVFAIIHGFSQNGEGGFTGSLRYLCDFTNTSKHTVIKALKELVEKNYVVKTQNVINGVCFNSYIINAPVVQKLCGGGAKAATGGSAKAATGGGEETAPNKIYNHNNASIETEQIVELYHAICVSYPKVLSLSERRKTAVLRLLSTYTKENFKTVFTNAENSAFLKGLDGGWKASFDWLMKENNFLKVLEGNYADNPRRQYRKEPAPGWKPSLGQAELEAIARVLREDLT